MSRNLLIFGFVLATAAGIGWWIAQSEHNHSSTGPISPKVSTPLNNTHSNQDHPSPNQTKLARPNPPQPMGNNQEHTTSEQRYRTLADHIANGSDNLTALLVGTLRDVETTNRLFAVQSANNLLADEAVSVLTEAALNDRKQVREEAWGSLATYTDEERESALSAVLSRGSQEALEDALTQIGDQPDKGMLNTMLRGASDAPASRQMRIVRAVQTWLDDGGETVPRFRTLQEAAGWWSSNNRHYNHQLVRTGN